MALQIVFSRFTFAGLFVTLLVFIGIVVGYTYLPKASITLVPATSARTIEQPIVLSTKSTAPDFKNYILPATIIRREATEQSTIEREGVTSRPDFAKGTVRLTNDQLDEQRLLPQTHLRHEASGIFFLTNTAVAIPPQSSIDVEVTAKEQGPTGNVPAGTFIVDKLPTSLQKVVYGTSDTAFSGGSVVDTPVTDADIDSAYEKVIDKAKTRILGELTNETGGAPIRPELLYIDTTERNSSVNSGSLASSFTVSVQVTGTAFIVDDNDLLSLTLLGLRSQENPSEEMIAYDPSSFSLSLVASSFDRGEAKFIGKLTGTFSQKIGAGALSTANLAGLSPQEVRDRFQEITSVSDVTVELSPFWVTKVPTRESAISISIANKNSGS